MPLLRANEIRIGKIIIETHSSFVVHTQKQEYMELMKHMLVKIPKAPREANMPAEWLAKQAIETMQGGSCKNIAPVELPRLLLHDLKGVCYPRPCCNFVYCSPTSRNAIQVTNKIQNF